MNKRLSTGALVSWERQLTPLFQSAFWIVQALYVPRLSIKIHASGRQIKKRGKYEWSQIVVFYLDFFQTIP